MKGCNKENNNGSTSKAQKENVQNDCENMHRRKCSICHKMGIMLLDVLIENDGFNIDRL